mgnify:CR=1 FL=1
MHDTEDKEWWLIHGEDLELQFVDVCKNKLNIDAQINPAKSTDPTAPDLEVNGLISDLKVQHTPFFTSNKYGLDPRYTITFNRNDYERYSEFYPDIGIYIWLDWKQLSSNYGSIQHYSGIFFLPFKEVARLIENSAPEHIYKKRVNDTQNNARSSFLLDIRNFQPVFLPK